MIYGPWCQVESIAKVHPRSVEVSYTEAETDENFWKENGMFDIDLQLFARKKGMGSSRNRRDSKPKCLDQSHDEVCLAGSIVRQRELDSPGLNRTGA